MGAAAVALAAPRWAFGAASEPAASSVGPNPVRLGLLGDFGDGKSRQFAIGERIAGAHDTSALDLIISTGDNIYPNGDAEDFGAKFERPFEPIIKRRVPFYAVLGNHDVRRGSQAQTRYPLFNMGGRSYYTVSAGGGTIDFFMLDSNDLDDRQLLWLDRALGQSTAVWKLPVFHHPIYSSGGHGSSTGRRKQLEPIFVRHGVQAAFSGHDHVYQRVTPQQGIQYFVSGAGGKLRKGDLKRDRLVAAGYDADSSFMLLEADAARLRFSAINAEGVTVDSGELHTPARAVAAAA